MQGNAVVLWLKEVLNAMVEMEKIPEVLKCGVVILIYKGGGRICSFSLPQLPNYSLHFFN